MTCKVDYRHEGKVEESAATGLTTNVQWAQSTQYNEHRQNKQRLLFSFHLVHVEAHMIEVITLPRLRQSYSGTKFSAEPLVETIYACIGSSTQQCKYHRTDNSAISAHHTCGANRRVYTSDILDPKPSHLALCLSNITLDYRINQIPLAAHLSRALLIKSNINICTSTA